ncbi:MAG: hypothetical protein IJ200_12820 [Prevotella sp.]|nr:hypothetical protein [Prevotella sp.]
MSKKEDWGNEIQPYDEYEDIRPHRRDDDEWDESDDDEDYDLRDPNLDPGFSSWDDFNRYMYG